MEINVPYKFEPRDYQLPVLKALDSGIKRAILIWHRRSGKDKVCWNYTIKEAARVVGTYYYYLPEFRQAKRVIWDNIDNDSFKMLDHIPKELVKRRNDSDLLVELINGSIIQLIGADSFKKSGVGANPTGNVFSEFAVTDPEAWNFVRPILAANPNAWAVFNTTPRGMNHAFKLLQQAKDDKKWFTQILTVEDTHAIPEDVLEDERRQMPHDLFEQEYYCKFVEGAGAFFRNIDNSKWKGEDKIEPDKRYQIGIDLGKYQDFTVLTAIDKHLHRVHKQERFNQMDWQTQEAKIEAFIRRYNNAEAWVDSTGVGDPIFENLASRGLNVQPYTFTERSRRELLDNLRLLLEEGRIKIPDDETLINELRSFQYSLTDTGRIKVGVPEGVHDDTVMSLALSVWRLGTPLPYAGKGMTLARLEDSFEELSAFDTME